MGDKQAEGELILKLYELRRDPELRRAREWYDVEFDPQSAKDVLRVFGGSFDESKYLRQALSYWEMVGGLASSGAVDPSLVHATNVEHIRMFAKIEPYLEDLRKTVGPSVLQELEKLVKTAPNYDEQMEGARTANKNWVDKRKAESV